MAFDVAQAFDVLPRIAVLAIAHPDLLRTWIGALAAPLSCPRRHRPFMIANAGLPEGCALSVAAMVFADMELHPFIQEKVPSAVLSSKEGRKCNWK